MYSKLILVLIKTAKLSDLKMILSFFYMVLIDLTEYVEEKIREIN